MLPWNQCFCGLLLESNVWLCSVAFASVACSADDLPVVEGVESPAADGCDVVGFGACWELVGVPGDGGSAEWAGDLALLFGLGDESLPPASVCGGCGAVGVCHRVSDPRLALYGSYLPL